MREGRLYTVPASFWIADQSVPDATVYVGYESDARPDILDRAYNIADRLLATEVL